MRYATAVAGAAAEQNAEDWWAALCAAVPAVVAGRRVLAVAVTAQAPTLVGVDADGDPTGPALTWVDRRASAEARWIADLTSLGRNGPDPYFGTAKLAWLAAHRRQQLDRTSTILSANGFIVRRLTGAASFDDSTAALTQAWDGHYDPVLAEHGVPTGLLPDPCPCAELVGQVTPTAAAATGIPAGTPVAAGGIDAVGAALEAGVLAPGDPFVEMTGFSTVGIAAIDRNAAVPGLIHSRHGLPGVDLLLTAQVTTGSVVDWLRGLTGGSDDLLDADPLLARPRPTRLLVRPSLAGERTPSWDASARGAVLGLDLRTDSRDLLLAVFEGTAFQLAADLDAVRAAGIAVPSVRAAGGGARSRAWLQVKADVLGVPVEVPVAGHGAAQGAAYLAGLAAGHFDVAALRQLGAQVATRVEPDPVRHRRYAQRRALFDAWTGQLADLERELAATTEAPSAEQAAGGTA